MTKSTGVIPIVLLVLTFALSACTWTNIQEPRHVVLLAPFEGLYRRSGYNALDAMRAVTDATPTDTPTHRRTDVLTYWIPTALDTSRDPLRAAQKALAPGNAAAVVGPLVPAEAAQVLPALQESGLRWYAPFATTESGFTAPNDPAWLESLVAAVASREGADSAQDRILIAGWEAFSTIIPLAEIAMDARQPVVWLEDAAEVEPGDLLLWLGDAAGGVRTIAALRAEHPDLAVWVPYWAAGDVFVEHANALDGWSWQGIEWGGWLPAGSGTLTPTTAEAALVVAATAAVGTLQPEFTFVSAPLTPDAMTTP